MNDFSVNRNFPEQYSKNIPEIFSLRIKSRSGIDSEFRNYGTFSLMEMEKNSELFSYVNRNPEFRWKP